MSARGIRRLKECGKRKDFKGTLKSQHIRKGGINPSASIHVERLALKQRAAATVAPAEILRHLRKKSPFHPPPPASLPSSKKSLATAYIIRKEEDGFWYREKNIWVEARRVCTVEVLHSSHFLMALEPDQEIFIPYALLKFWWEKVPRRRRRRPPKSHEPPLRLLSFAFLRARGASSLPSASALTSTLPIRNSE